MKFDESTGQQLTAQVDFKAAGQSAAAAKEAPHSHALPWVQWLNDSRDVGCAESAKASAVAVEGAIHERWETSQAQMDI